MDASAENILYFYWNVFSQSLHSSGKWHHHDLSSVRLCVKVCWCKHSVLEMIFNFLLLPVSSFILQIPRMMNYRKRLAPPSFLRQFWAKLPALLVSAAKFIARARPGIYTVSRNSTFFLAWNITFQIRKQRRRCLNFTRRTRVLSSMRRPLTSSLRTAAVVPSDGFLSVFYIIFCLYFSCFCFHRNIFCIFSTAVSGTPIIPHFSERCGLQRYAFTSCPIYQKENKCLQRPVESSYPWRRKKLNSP